MNNVETDAHPGLSARDIRAILTGLMVAMFPGALDTTIIGPAMPTIGRDLGDIEHLPWIVTSYLLVSTAVTPLYGKLSDIHGRRVMLLAAIGIFAVGSVLCAVAPSMIWLAFARALQGLGGGGLISLAMTVVGDIVPPRERPRYQIYMSVMWTTSSLLGPILGGYFAELWHWSLIFWINLPICLAAFLLTSSKLKRLPRHERPHKLDFAGAILLVIGSGLLQLTLSWGGTRYAWTSTPIFALVAATLLFIGLLVWRLLRAAEPLIPFTLLSNNVVLTGAVSVGVTMAMFVGLTIYVPVYFEGVRGMSASHSGLALLPLMVCSTIGAVTAGRMMVRFARYKFVALIGLALAALALTPIFFWPLDIPIVGLEILLAIVSTGIGAVFPTTTVSVQNAVAPHELGTAISLVTFMRNLGAAIGVAIFGAIVIGGGAIPGDHAAAPAIVGPEFASVFRWIFFAGSVGFLLALLVLAMMEERPLVGKNPTQAR